MKRLFFTAAVLLSLSASLSAQESELGKTLRQVESLIDVIEFSRPSANATVRYPNNQVATNIFGSPNATWYWPNGKTITNIARSSSASWYWPNGKMMTMQIGSPSATWWWPDGQTMSLRGPGFSAAELENTPVLAARVLRLAVRNGY